MGFGRRLRVRDRDGPEFEHVVFELEIQDGWPPVSGERVWARRLDLDQFEIDSIPWFVRGIASGDIVRAVQRDGEHPTFTERIRWGGNLTIRIIPFSAGPLHGDLQAVIDLMTPLGVETEGALPAYPIVACNVPPSVDLAALKELLHRGKADDAWEYEEGCVSDAWIGL